MEMFSRKGKQERRFEDLDIINYLLFWRKHELISLVSWGILLEHIDS